jgi:type I restriction enzyme, S subunit
MRLPAYPSYRPSGIEWLGDVPEHWDAKRLKTSATYWVSNVDKVPSEDEVAVRLCNYTDVYYHDYIRPDMGLMETTATHEEIRRFGLQVGDVVITKDSEEWSDIAVPALVVESAPDFVCGYHLAIVRPNTSALLGRYLLRVFQACAVNQQFQVAATGVTRYGLPKSSIGEAWLPLPSTSEQQAIADFLEHETANIDRLVAKKQALIERLEEKRTALISRSVSHGLPPAAARAAGLDPHPKLNPSTIDWVGNVPEHWDVKPLKRSVRFLEGPGIMAADFADDGIPLLRIAGIGGRIATLDGCNYLAPDLVSQRWSHFRVRRGDLLISGSASTGFCSEVDEVTEGAVPYTGIIIVRPRSNVAERTFIRWFLLSRSFLTQAELARSGSTIQHFGPSHLSRMVVALPPLSEQRVVAEFLDRETAMIDQMSAKVEAAIQRLQEYRTAVITAAVTGKIDVREPAV